MICWIIFLRLYQPARHGILLIAKATNLNSLEKDGGLLNLLSGSSYSDTSGRFPSRAANLPSGYLSPGGCILVLLLRGFVSIKKKKKVKHFIAGNKLFKYLVYFGFDWSCWEVCQGRDERAGNNRTPQQPKRDSKKHLSFLLMISVWLLCVNSSQFVPVIMISVASPRRLISHSFQHVLIFCRLLYNAPGLLPHPPVFARKTSYTFSFTL